MRNLTEGGAGGLHDQCRDIVPAFDDAPEVFDVVWRTNDGVTDDFGKDARRSLRSGRRVPEHNVIVPAMEVGCETDEVRFARVSAGDPQRQVRGLCAGDGESDPFGARDHFPDQRCPLQLQLVGRAKVSSTRDLTLHRVQDLRMIVAQE